MVAALFGAAVIVGGLTSVDAPGEVSAVGADSTLELKVTGVVGVPADASAVAVNLTIVNAQAAGFATVYPCGAVRPEASNINYSAGQTIANSAFAKPGVDGKVCIYTYASAEVLVDVAGYFPAGSDYEPIANPSRILDTRNGIGAPAAQVAAGQTLELQSTGVAGVPADASAVAVNLTIVGAAASGFATMFPCGAARPDASNINYTAGQTIANSVIAKPGTDGKLCIYNYANVRLPQLGAVDVLVDVAGFFPAGSDFEPIPNPTRILDTRNGIGAPVAPLAAGETLEFQADGVAGVPIGADAIALNVTVVNARAAGFVTVYPCFPEPLPEASNLNFVAGQTIANLVIAKPGTGLLFFETGGKVCIYSDATIDVLADVSGSFPTGSGFTAIANPARILDTRNGIGT